MSPLRPFPVVLPMSGLIFHWSAEEWAKDRTFYLSSGNAIEYSPGEGMDRRAQHTRWRDPESRRRRLKPARVTR